MVRFRAGRVAMLGGLVAASYAETTVRLTPLASGANEKIGALRYEPQAIVLVETRPDSLKKLPDGVAAPRFGILPIGQTLENKAGGRAYHVVLDEPADQEPRLFVDSNGNGDMTDDPQAEWQPKEVPGPEKDGPKFKQYSGGGSVELPNAGGAWSARLGMYRFDPKDPARAMHKEKLLYFRDYALEGEIEFSGKALRAVLSDERATGNFSASAVKTDRDDARDSGVLLWVDVNGDGKFDASGERFDAAKPFTIVGASFEIRDIAPDGTSFKLLKSSKVTYKVTGPPDHSVGKKITPFEATTLDGKKLKFPEDYKGKLVMLDFWATWCRPCVNEIPGLVKAHAAYRGKGFEVLGISLDHAGQTDKVQKLLTEKQMAWPQVYDGKGWNAEIAKLYGVRSIPATYLVDGDTGEIVASADSLRGDKLDATLEKEVARKFSNKSVPANGDSPEGKP